MLDVLQIRKSRMQISLPVPDSDERAHSQRLEASLKAWIGAHGPMPFSKYMEHCLYSPGLGYYSAGAVKFGAEGDFVTATELGPLFARSIAQVMAPVLQSLGDAANWLELGAGSGAFAADVLLALAAAGSLPRFYWILETSADLRQRQRQALEQRLPPHLVARVEWLERPPERPWQGVIFANEVIDALPATRFCRQPPEFYEEYVDLDAEGALCLIDQPAKPELAAIVAHLEDQLGAPFASGYRSECLPQLPSWLQAISATLSRGALLFFDYGYPRREYYRAERQEGTLMAHYRHRAHADPLLWPGLNDLTASVDFSALAEAGRTAGLALDLYTTQAHFLLAGGLPQHFEQAYAEASDSERLRLAQQVRTLTLPERMGERFQALLFSRDLAAPWSAALLATDLSRRL